jgi:hypothetical protein
MTNIKIATSGLSNRIYAGHIKKNGFEWKADKTDVTGQVCGAVIEHVLNNGEPVSVTVNGVPKYRIIVEEVKNDTQ